MTFIDSKLKEFERICKDCKIKNNKKRDKYLRNEYMKVYYYMKNIYFHKKKSCITT